MYSHYTFGGALDIDAYKPIYFPETQIGHHGPALILAKVTLQGDEHQSVRIMYGASISDNARV